MSVIPSLPDSVHLTRWPADEMAAFRDDRAGGARWPRRATRVDLARTLRAPGRAPRPPAAGAGVARACPTAASTLDDELLALFADEVNVKRSSVIADGSELVERRVKPLLPKIGKRLGAAIPAVMAAAREGAVEFHDDGSVTLAGETLAADEVEIQATPRPGTAVADHDGLVVVLDTALTPGAARRGRRPRAARAVQDLRKDAELELDDRIELWVDGTRGWRRGAHLAIGPARHARRARGRGRPAGPMHPRADGRRSTPDP